jgi:kumamolisin
VAVCALALTSALPAQAFAATPVSGTEMSATLVLRTPNPAATSSLAQAGGLSRADRLARLAGTIPSAAVKASVRSSIGGLGLTVDDSTPWTIVVHGPAAAVRALASSGRAAGGGVVYDPASVAGVASVVIGGQGSRMTPMAAQPLKGSDFRTTYQASDAAPPAGSSAPVIATLQFAGWNASELGAYATWAGLPTPAAGQFTAVSIDGASTTLDDGFDGAAEVALDQESIYSTNRFATQRGYFVTNGSGQGELDAYYRIAADALTSSGIVALSISWGRCEQTHEPFVALVHNAIASLVATGVTVFASSGDDGALCRDGSTGVNYPASDPLVVAVGGTSLDLVGPQETGWSGSGGGLSQFPRPAYQAAALPSVTTRAVPDIAADADPNTGFDVVHDFGTGFGLEYDTFGGTSLASPISAAMLTTELASRGLTNGGIGDIHSALYAAPATSFRDVVSGNNGFAAGSGYDMVTGLGAPYWHPLVDQLVQAPVVSAPAFTTSKTVPVSVTAPGGQTFLSWATGYGTPPTCTNNSGKPAAPAPVTVPSDGVYTVWAQGYLSYQRCLTAVTTVVVDGAAPTVSVTAKASSSTGKTVQYGWAVSDPTSGVGNVLATVLRNGKVVWSATTAGSSTVTLKGQLGSIYQLVVVATDKAGNASTAKKALSVAYDDKSFKLSTGWSRVRSHAAFGGTLVKSAKTGATARVKAYGSSFAFLTTTCSTCGIVGVFVDGKHLRDISLFSKATKAQVVVNLASYHQAKAHTIVLVVRGAKAQKSKGKVVNVDGLLAR